MNEKTEKLKKTIIRGKNGGKRPGAGMPKGTKIKRTLEKEAVKRAMNERTLAIADKLHNAKSLLALGSHSIFMIEHYEDESGRMKKRHVLVTDEKLQADILDNPDMIQGENYVRITNNSPDLKAIESMEAMVWGKPTQTLDINHSNIKEVLDEQDKEEQIDV
jgi:hypothetical protein